MEGCVEESGGRRKFQKRLSLEVFESFVRPEGLTIFPSLSLHACYHPVRNYSQSRSSPTPLKIPHLDLRINLVHDTISTASLFPLPSALLPPTLLRPPLFLSLPHISHPSGFSRCSLDDPPSTPPPPITNPNELSIPTRHVSLYRLHNPPLPRSIKILRRIVTRVDSGPRSEVWGYR